MKGMGVAAERFALFESSRMGMTELGYRTLTLELRSGITTERLALRAKMHI